MSKIIYAKTALNYGDQLKQLGERGLIIDDVVRATHLLGVISYYRLSGYWYPLLEDKQNHIFKSNARFETAFNLYCFDRDLRKLVTAELEKVEIAIRAKMIYVLSCKYGPFWYQDTNLFSDPNKHQKCLKSLRMEYERSDEQFLKAFKKKYSDDLPPSWMIMEVLSFGSLSIIYKNLKSSPEKKEIAKYFGVSDSILESWLHSIVYLRNICAHHSRLWNRVLSIRPIKPRHTTNQWLRNTEASNDRTYYLLSVILYLLQTVDHTHDFNKKIKFLLNDYPNVEDRAMGFPNDWRLEPLWC